MDPETLKALRRSAHLTQADLADRLKIDRTSVTRVENGERRIDAALLERWAAACGAVVTVVPDDREGTLTLRVQQLREDDQRLVAKLLDALPGLSADNRQTLTALLDAWSVKKL